MWILILGLIVIILAVIIIEHQNAKKIQKLKDKYLYNREDWSTWYRRKLPIDIPEDHGTFKFVSSFLSDGDAMFNIASYKDGIVYGYFNNSEEKLQIIGYYSYFNNITGLKVCSIYNRSKIEVGRIEDDGYIYLTRKGYYDYFSANNPYCTRYPSPLEIELGRILNGYIEDAETHHEVGEFDGEKFGAAAACICLSVECHTNSKYSNFVSKW